MTGRQCDKPMSDPVLVALIGGAALVLVAALGYFGQRSNRKSMIKIGDEAGRAATLASDQMEWQSKNLRPKNGLTLAETIEEIHADVREINKDIRGVVKLFTKEHNNDGTHRANRAKTKTR